MNIDRIAAQYRRPSGLRGLAFAKKMEGSNAPTYAWLLPRLEVRPRDKVLEIGFGAGWGLNALAREYPEMSLFGIDFSRLMCRRARKKNRAFVKSGRVRLFLGDILDYDRARDFDLVFCVNVVYFLKRLDCYFSKLLGLLKPGGKLHIYMASEERLGQVPHARSSIFEKYTLDFVKAELRRSGFRDIGSQTNETPKGPSYLVTAVKPQEAGDG